MIASLLASILLVGVCYSRDCEYDGSALCGLGEGYYIPSLSLVEDNGNGKSVFKNLDAECIKKVPSLIDREEKTFYENTHSFYSKIGGEAGLPIDLWNGYTLAASILGASDSIDSHTIDVKGMSMDVYAITSFYNILPDCLVSAPLDEEFLQAFTNLPVKVEDPSLSSSWYMYNNFIETYGSHVTKRISQGSRLTRYVFSKSNEKISMKEFLIKTCATLKMLHIKACANFTDGDYDKVASLATSEGLVVRGGSTETRAKLMVNVTNELLVEFLKEANLTDEPVTEQYHSIWDLLKSRYLGTEHFVKAINLQSYYHGYLATGCQLSVANRVVLRRFVLVEDDPNVPGYECQLAPMGCRGDHDCHLGSFAMTCNCYGYGCVNTHSTPDPRHDLQKGRYVKTSKDGSSSFVGVNWSCRYQVGIYCTCDKTWGGSWETVWPKDFSYNDNMSFLRFAQQKLEKFKRT